MVIDNCKHLSHTNVGDNNDYIDDNDDEREKGAFFLDYKNNTFLIVGLYSVFDSIFIPHIFIFYLQQISTTIVEKYLSRLY